VPGSCELEGARLALEEAHAKRVFELFHLMTYSGRREEQLIGSHFEAAVVGGDAERAQISQRRGTG
jgi:hypothetical protein